MFAKLKKLNSKVQVLSINTIHNFFVDYNYITQGDVW